MTVTEAPQSAAYERPDGIIVVPRGEFAADRFRYEPGHHVVFAGPTQRGKTSLAFRLLEHTATPELPAWIAVSKPSDPVTLREGRRLGYRRISDYPPPPRIREVLGDKPPGYLVWPDMRDPDTSMDNASIVTRRLIRGVYAQGARGRKSILMLDDTVTKSKVLRLDDDMVMVLTMSGAMGIGGWCFVQKPTDAGKAALWSYSQSEHIFITKDPDKRNRERYREIGGFDSRVVDEVSQSLKPYQFLYLERTHGYMCVVDSR